jgi:two-component system response regulator YesN
MYKILIVDDEELVRRSIIRIVDWKALGFTEVYEAENGVDALKIALEVSPHLVLTDIRMPFMDGLQLTSKLKEQLPSTHIVILSGHDEFTYAQDAIGLGVLDYILKPLGAAALTAKMQAIRQTLDEDYQEKQYLAKVQTQLHQSLPLLKENFLNTLVCTPGSKIGLASRLNFLDIPLAKGPFAISVIEPDLSDISPSDIEVYNFSVKNIALETVGVNHPVFSENSGKVVIAFCIPALPAETDKRNSIIETLNVLQKSINIY